MAAKSLTMAIGSQWEMSNLYLKRNISPWIWRYRNTQVSTAAPSDRATNNIPTKVT